MESSAVNRDDFERITDPLMLAQVAKEKLAYMLKYAKSSTIATILAPLLCVPLYVEDTGALPFNAWFGLMAVAVTVRLYLIRAIDLDGDQSKNFKLLNGAVGIVTLMWGMGWLILVPSMDPVNYLIYQIISLTVLFVGMVGYCVHWKTFFCFVLPLKIPELFFTVIYFDAIVWPIALGSMVAFYLALKMGFLFSKSWERSVSLRFRNDALFQDLVAEKDASVAANVAKSDFIATASHDLRQPMQALNIFVEMVDLSQLKAREASIFSKMRKSIGVLNKMFNTLLDVSKLDANADFLNREFELDALVQDAKLAFAHLAEEKGIDLHVAYDKCLVMGDHDLLSQVLWNLLSNAIQYTDKGQVSVTFSVDNGCLQLSVNDTGCGIPLEDQPFIFKEFFRSSHSRSQYDGLGLGLTIVSRIVRKIGGELEVQSVVGQGSTFTVKTVFQVSPSKASSLATEVHALPPSHAPEDRALPGAAPLASQRHLGIIENEASLQDAYREFFTKAGYVVHLIPYTEPEFNAALLQLPRPDVILSDFRLGDKDGVYFISRLREEFNDHIPACILTADTSPQHVLDFKAMGIDVLYKPIDVVSIEKFIAKQLALSGSAQDGSLQR